MGIIMVYILLFVVAYFSCKLIFEMIGEVVFSRLHKAKWYRKLAGKDKTESKPDIDKTRIGF